MTRADFYVDRFEKMEWLGSISGDGYPEPPGVCTTLDLTITDPAKWREAVAVMLAKESDSTTPDLGWPWPWNDSRTTDYAYSFWDGRVWVSSFGGPWRAVGARGGRVRGIKDIHDTGFPDMTARKAVTLGPRSGLFCIKNTGDGIAIQGEENPRAKARTTR